MSTQEEFAEMKWDLHIDETAQTATVKLYDRDGAVANLETRHLAATNHGASESAHETGTIDVPASTDINQIQIHIGEFFSGSRYGVSFEIPELSGALSSDYDLEQLNLTHNSA